MLDFQISEELKLIVETVRQACAQFDDAYWRHVDSKKIYPKEFVDQMVKYGFLSMSIPSNYGGGGTGVTESSMVIEEIARSGCDGGAIRAQIYLTAAFNRIANQDQKDEYLPKIARGDLRFQTFAVTEARAGTETTNISTFAEKDGDNYVINGQKMWISRVMESDLMLLLARNKKVGEVSKKTLGMTLFLVDLKKALRDGTVKAKPIEMMINHSANEILIENLVVPKECVVGEVGRGFYHVLSVMNSERIINSSDTMGSAHFLLSKAVEYAKMRVVFGRPIGQNQGVQFPIASAYAKLEAASALRFKAAWLYDNSMECGKEANILKYLSSEIGVEASNVAMTTMGGMGMAVEGGIERKFREMRLHIIAPVSNNLALSYIASKVLDLPRSY
jgi:acyl-CoA dehydrogenase